MAESWLNVASNNTTALPSWDIAGYPNTTIPVAADPLAAYTFGLQANQPNPSGLPAGTPTESSWDSFSRMLLGGKDGATGNTSVGMLTGGLGAAGSILNGYLGLQQLQVAKDNLAFQKDSFNKNFAAQSKLTNSQLEDRQRSRNQDSPGNYESVSSYMSKYGV